MPPLEFAWWRLPRRRVLHFQLAGNRIERNAVSGSRLGMAIEGGVFGPKRSVDNCFSENRYTRSLPADLRPFACTKATAANPGAAASKRIRRLVGRLHREFLARRAHGQPAPPRQPTMTHPCAARQTETVSRERQPQKSRSRPPLCVSPAEPRPSLAPLRPSLTHA
jgi:hypothetical protein